MRPLLQADGSEWKQNCFCICLHACGRDKGKPSPPLPPDHHGCKTVAGSDPPHAAGCSTLDGISCRYICDSPASRCLLPRAGLQPTQGRPAWPATNNHPASWAGDPRLRCFAAQARAAPQSMLQRPRRWAKRWPGGASAWCMAAATLGERLMQRGMCLGRAHNLGLRPGPAGLVHQRGG